MSSTDSSFQIAQWLGSLTKVRKDTELCEESCKPSLPVRNVSRESSLELPRSSWRGARRKPGTFDSKPSTITSATSGFSTARNSSSVVRTVLTCSLLAANDRGRPAEVSLNGGGVEVALVDLGFEKSSGVIRKTNPTRSRTCISEKPRGFKKAFQRG